MAVYLHIYVASVVKCLVIVILYVPDSQFHSQNQFLRSGNETDAPTPIEQLVSNQHTAYDSVYTCGSKFSTGKTKSYIDLIGNELYNQNFTTQPLTASSVCHNANMETESLGDLVMCADVMKCKEVEGRQGSGW